MNIKLKACPFCGGAARLFDRISAGFIECTECHATSGICETKEFATNRWNSRVDTRHIGKIKDASAELDEMFEEFD